MFGELPSFFDRDFAVGYFLPVLTFLMASLVMATTFHIFTSLLPSWQSNLVVGTTIFAAASWLLAIVLLGANRTIIRFLEGYGDHNPLKLFAHFETSLFDEWTGKLDTYRKEYVKLLNELEKVPDDSKEESDRIQKQLDNIEEKSDKKERELVDRFPAERQWVLPTAFGNAIRAFETYSKTMYGIDAIVGWTRLLSVMPQDFRELIDEAKAEMDFWVNVWVLAAFIVGEYVGLAIFSRSLAVLSLIWPIAATVVIIFAKSRARSAAIEWGDLVKASFDVYLPTLRAKLELPAESDREKEIALWNDFSQAAMYRLPTSLPSRRMQLTSDGDLEDRQEDRQEAHDV